MNGDGIKCSILLSVLAVVCLSCSSERPSSQGAASETEDAPTTTTTAIPATTTTLPAADILEASWSGLRDAAQAGNCLAWVATEDHPATEAHLAQELGAGGAAAEMRNLLIERCPDAMAREGLSYMYDGPAGTPTTIPPTTAAPVLDLTEESKRIMQEQWSSYSSVEQAQLCSEYLADHTQLTKMIVDALGSQLTPEAVMAFFMVNCSN